jgi:hypothetical protein
VFVVFNDTVPNSAIYTFDGWQSEVMLHGSQALLLARHDTAMQTGMLRLSSRRQQKKRGSGVLDGTIERKEICFSR